MNVRLSVPLIGAILLLAVGCAPTAVAPTAAPAVATAAVASPAASPVPAGAATAASPVASPASVAASPSARPAASPASSPVASPAAAGPQAVNGEVDSVDGRVVTVATNTGVRRVRVPESVQVTQEGAGATADLLPGALVGVTGRPDGTAVVVRLFPPGVTPKPDQFPMGGAQAGNVMTNARIDAFDGRVLTLDLGGQKATITVPPEAQVVKPLPASFAEIQPGKRMIAVGAPSGDVLEAQSVTIVTQPSVQRAP